MSVLNKLKEESGKSFSLKSKQECPKCSKKTFSIKKDDSFAKCFHPACGYKISDKYTPHIQEKEYTIIDQIFRVFNIKFLGNKEGKAYRYCEEDRKINSEVIEKSLLGEACEIPKELTDEVDALHGSVQSEIDKFIKKYDLESEYKDDDIYKSLVRRKSQLEKFIKFFKDVKNYEGWLVTAFTDEDVNILSLKLRQPFSKYRASLKPFKRQGVFGLNLLGDFMGITGKKGLILTEGEFNTLQYHSSLIRGRSEIKSPPIVSFGSASSPDFKTILALNSINYLCYDNDDAGKSCVNKFAERLNFYAFTVPWPHKDLDDLLKPTETNFTSHEIMKILIESAEFVEMDFNKTIEEVNLSRAVKNAQAHIRNQKTTEFVIRDLKEKGRFYKSKGRYFFLRNKDNIVYKIMPKDEDLSNLLITFYKINPSEDTCKYILGEISNECLKVGKEVKTSFFSHYHEKDNSLFIYNFQDIVYQIKADGTINKSKNGQKNILFLQTKNATPFIMNLDAKFDYNPLDSLLFKEVFDKGNFKVSDNGLSHRGNAILLLYYFYSLLFMNKFNTRPIACLIGEKGSGKTTIGKLTGKVIYGESFNISALPSKVDDFDVLITNDSFHVLDNVDSTPDWLLDRLALIATGGVIKKRKLYSDNTLCEYPIDCMLFITSRTPRFTRDDIADRIIPFYFDRLQDKGFLPESKMSADLLAIREPILSEIIELHIPFILKAIEEHGKPEYRASFRMAEFAEFATMLSNKLGINEEHKQIFKCLEKSQKEFALRDSPLFELLDTYITLKATHNQANSSFEIYNLLQSHLAHNGNKMPFNSAQQFTAHFSNNLTALKDDFKIEANKGRSNRMVYCIFKLDKKGLDSETNNDNNTLKIDTIEL